MTSNLVTGGAGLIGFEIARQLLQRGDTVALVDCFRKGGRQDVAELTAKFGDRITAVEADLQEPRAFASPIARRYDVVFHMAASVGVRYVNENPYETAHNNLLATVHVADFALAHGCGKIVYASSSENYAAGADLGIIPIPTPEAVLLTIADPKLPRWSYATGKIAGESLVLSMAHKHPIVPVVIRFHNVYGPRMRPTHVIPELVERVRRKTNPFPIYGSDNTRSFLHVDDAARAVILLGDKVQGPEIYNVGSADEVMISDVAGLIFEAAGFHPTVVKEPAPPGSVKRRAPDTAKLRALGFAPQVSLREGIRQCLRADDGRAGWLNE